jgi:threonine aldolase
LCISAVVGIPTNYNRSLSGWWGHQPGRKNEDHKRAQEIGEAFGQKSFVNEVLPVETNIVIVRLEEDRPLEGFLAELKEKGILAVPFGHQTLRMVTHLDITDQMVEDVTKVIRAMD